MKVPEHARGLDALAVFALSGSGNRLPPQVLPYLAGLRQVASAVVVVCDTRLADCEVKKLAVVADHVIATSHSEQAFGSYQRGVAWARKTGRLDRVESLILCDGSFYGPIGSFAPMVEAMAAKGLDAWAATDSTVSEYHLQSYFMVLGRAAFSAKTIKDYIANTRRPASIQNYTRKCEIELTRAFKAAGTQHRHLHRGRPEGGSQVRRHLPRPDEVSPPPSRARAAPAPGGDPDRSPCQRGRHRSPSGMAKGA